MRLQKKSKSFHLTYPQISFISIILLILWIIILIPLLDNMRIFLQRNPLILILYLLIGLFFFLSGSMATYKWLQEEKVEIEKLETWYSKNIENLVFFKETYIEIVIIIEVCIFFFAIFLSIPLSYKMAQLIGFWSTLIVFLASTGLGIKDKNVRDYLDRQFNKFMILLYITILFLLIFLTPEGYSPGSTPTAILFAYFFFSLMVFLFVIMIIGLIFYTIDTLFRPPRIGTKKQLPHKISFKTPIKSSIHESDIETFLFNHPENIEPNLMILKRQFNTGVVGIIDLLAEDDQGNIVVIELKRGKGTDKIVGQISRYLTWANQEFNKPVRGIIIVQNTSQKLEYAVKSIKHPVIIKEFGSHVPVFDQVKYCQKCGFSNHQTASYCQKCGESFRIV